MSTVTPAYVTATPEIWRKCKWCPDWFEYSHGNSKYCSDTCKKEALLEQKRNYQRAYRWKNRRETELKKMGTAMIGAHRIDDIQIESVVVRRERNRVLFSTVISKDKRFKSEIGIMVTHPYATANDYFQHNLTLITGLPISTCVECYSQDIMKDYKRAEVVCHHCGLVLQGPPADGIMYPWEVI